MDMGVFSFLKDFERLAAGYQNIMPQQRFKVKGFFSCHLKDYGRLSEQQKAIRFSDNYKSLLVAP